MLKRRSLDVYAATPAKKKTAVAGFQFEELTEKHFAEADFCQPRLALFRNRLEDGFAAHGLIASNGQLAYYMWLTFADGEGWAPWALGARIDLPEASGYIFDCKTAPEYRNKGLYSAALKYARWLCDRRGCSKVLIDVEPSNAPAVKAIKNAGFKKRATTEIVKLGPIYRTIGDSESSFGWKRASYTF